MLWVSKYGFREESTWSGFVLTLYVISTHGLSRILLVHFGFRKHDSHTDPLPHSRSSYPGPWCVQLALRLHLLYRCRWQIPHAFYLAECQRPDCPRRIEPASYPHAVATWTVFPLLETEDKGRYKARSQVDTFECFKPEFSHLAYDARF